MTVEQDLARLQGEVAVLQRLAAQQPQVTQTLEAVLQHIRNHDEIVVGTAAPTHVADEPTLFWDKTNDLFYINSGGSTWIKIGGAGISAHAILDGSTHSDSVAQGVTRGSIIYANSTPKWDELVISIPASAGARNILAVDNGESDISWQSADVIVDADGDTKIQLEESADEDIIRMDLAGIERFRLEGLTATQSSQSNGASFSPQWLMARARGTEGSPTAVQAGDLLGAFGVAPHDGAGYDGSVIFRFDATENHDATSHGNKAAISTVPNGSVTATLALTVEQDQNIRLENGIYLKEKADADADVADYGQLWVDTQTPNALFFTDDAGTDFSISLRATDSISGPVELATAAETKTGTDATRAVTPASLGTADRTFILTAGGGWPTATNGCAQPARIEAGTNFNNYWVLDFDTGADEHAFWVHPLPDNYDGGTVKFRIYWTTTNTGTEGVAFFLKARAYANSDAIDQAWGTAVGVTDDNLSAAGDVLISGESAVLTIGGGPAAGELVIWDLYRDVSDGNDDMTQDARILSVKITYTTNLYSD